MRTTNILIIFLVFSLILACSSKIHLTKKGETKNPYIELDANEEGQYDIIVFDYDYNTYLETIAKPINFYSKSYYKNKNTWDVVEWNNRVNNPFKYNPSIYELEINYNPKKDYGLLLEYKLYNFFRFIEHKYKLKFQNTRG